MRRMRELDREYGGRTPAPGRHPRHERRRRRQRDPLDGRRPADRRLASAVLLVAVLAVGAWSFAASVLGPGFGIETVKRALGLPSAPAGDAGSYAFLATQPGSPDVPVTYSPCREIVLVVNDRLAPEGTEGLVDEAVTEVAELTGLRLRVAGTTGEEPSAKGSRDGRQPVLLAWSDPDSYPSLEGDVAGVGGSTQVRSGGSLRAHYVTGQVVLDAPQLEDVLDDVGREEVKAVILHELGHVVGLAHVDDATQLMHDESVGQTDFGAGDRAGLKILGQGTCSL
jgi:hypothetical protein